MVKNHGYQNFTIPKKQIFFFSAFLIWSIQYIICGSTCSKLLLYPPGAKGPPILFHVNIMVCEQYKYNVYQMIIKNSTQESCQSQSFVQLTPEYNPYLAKSRHFENLAQNSSSSQSSLKYVPLQLECLTSKNKLRC